MLSVKAWKRLPGKRGDQRSFLKLVYRCSCSSKQLTETLPLTSRVGEVIRTEPQAKRALLDIMNEKHMRCAARGGGAAAHDDDDDVVVEQLEQLEQRGSSGDGLRGGSTGEAARDPLGAASSTRPAGSPGARQGANGLPVPTQYVFADNDTVLGLVDGHCTWCDG